MSGEGKQSAACEVPVKRPFSTLRAPKIGKNPAKKLSIRFNSQGLIKCGQRPNLDSLGSRRIRVLDVVVFVMIFSASSRLPGLAALPKTQTAERAEPQSKYRSFDFVRKGILDVSGSLARGPSEMSTALPIRMFSQS